MSWGRPIAGLPAAVAKGVMEERCCWGGCCCWSFCCWILRSSDMRRAVSMSAMVEVKTLRRSRSKSRHTADSGSKPCSVREHSCHPVMLIDDRAAAPQQAAGDEPHPVLE